MWCSAGMRSVAHSFVYFSRHYFVYYTRLDGMTRRPVTATEAERLLRRAARQQKKNWTVQEVPGKDGRRRGKGSHKMIRLCDKDGNMLAWTTIPQHPGDLSPRVSREIEAAFEPHLGKGWMGR
jgi:hypothetical protein